MSKKRNRPKTKWEKKESRRKGRLVSQMMNALPQRTTLPKFNMEEILPSFLAAFLFRRKT